MSDDQAVLTEVRGRVLVITAGDDLIGLHFDGHARTPDLGARTSGTGATLQVDGGMIRGVF